MSDQNNCIMKNHSPYIWHLLTFGRISSIQFFNHATQGPVLFIAQNDNISDMSIFFGYTNSLWPNGAIWYHRSGSTLVQTEACCLIAPSHYFGPMLTYHQQCSVTLIRKSKDYVYGIWVYKVLGIWIGYYKVKAFRLIKIREILPEVHMDLIHDIYSEILLSKLLPHLPETNELI